MQPRIAPTGPAYDPYNITRGRERRPRNYTPPSFIYEHAPTFRARVSRPSLDWIDPDHHAGTCWLWTGPTRSDGQAFFRTRGVQIPIRRFAYELDVGLVAEDLVVRAACEVARCVTPLHLYLRPRNQQPHMISTALRENLRVMHHDHDHPIAWLADHYGLSDRTVARAVHALDA